MAKGRHKNILLTTSESVGLYVQVTSKDIIIYIVNTLLSHEILQILLVYRLLKGDVTLQEIHLQHA